MIQKSNESDRRILTFPAIQPCQCIAPAKLLTSLINVTRNICGYRSKFFGGSKRNANAAIRQIGIILTFLEQIRDGDSDLPDSIVLCFSELHFIFQKIQFLLEDCALEGARLFMLMKSDLVANRFRVLARSVAVALDVLPLVSIDVPIEVKEHLELVMKQARTAKFEVDRGDEEIINEVKLILSLFEYGAAPDKSKIKRVLDHIGIENWSSCNKEVKFLDSEIEFEWLSRDKTDVAFLSDLMAFMNYCRSILFDVVDCDAIRHVDRFRTDILHCLNPDDFRCSISLDFMIDPVTVATGHTYDRSSIQKWLRAGNFICPNTGEKLKNRELVPNLALRRIIHQYCTENSIPFAEPGRKKRDITRTVAAGSSTAEKISRELAKFLADVLESGTSEEKNRAAYEIKHLSKASIFNRSCLVETGLIPNLLKLLRSLDVLTQENAIAAVLNLSKHSQSKSAIASNGGLQEIVHVLQMGYRIEARQLAAGALFYMASIAEYRRLIGEIPEAIPALTDLFMDTTDRSKKNAMVALFGLLVHPENHRKVLSAGAVPLLVNLLMTSGKENLMTDSMAILASLAERPDGAAAILQCGALNSIMGFVDSCSSIAGKEYSVFLLVALCVNGGLEVIPIMAKNQTLMSSLYNVVSEGTSRGRWKAKSLIRLLHAYCENESSSSSPVVHRLPQDRMVHVW